MDLSVQVVRGPVHMRKGDTWHLSRRSQGGDNATFVNCGRKKLKMEVRFSPQTSLYCKRLSAPLRDPTLLCQGAWFAVCLSSGGAKHYPQAEHQWLLLNKSKVSQPVSIGAKGTAFTTADCFFQWSQFCTITTFGGKSALEEHLMNF